MNTIHYSGEKIVIFDFWWQFTQNIAKNIRKLGVYSEVVPFHQAVDMDQENIKGVILSGSPCSVHQENAPQIDLEWIIWKKPLLWICYGAQYIAHTGWNTVSRAEHRQYGTASLSLTSRSSLFQDIPELSDVLMSHGDSIAKINNPDMIILGSSNDIIAAYELQGKETPVYGVQFHPEVSHTQYGEQFFKNFLFEVCWCLPDSWTPTSFIQNTIANIKQQLWEDHCLMAISWWVDSTVAATLIHQAIWDRLHCVFVDNGLLRKDEYTQVLETYKKIWLNVTWVEAKEEFYTALAWVTDPEQKRKAIGKTFIDIFDQEAKKISNISRLGQWTIYPDVIESVSVNGPSSTIKSHHNVWGLPEEMDLKLIEPLRFLFKDDVREVWKDLGIPEFITGRHPFPGPGLAIRIIWQEVNAENVSLLQEADHIFIEWLKNTLAEDGKSWYHHVWQAGTILLPVKSVGVMGDERTYESTVVLRAVHSVDGMTASWIDFPHSFLSQISKDIIAKVKGINRVVYDISDKPPATIEWE